jgi:sulfide:quinone oxidoreductase
MTEPEATAGVLIAGGGVAALEAMMALRDLAGERVRMTLVAPEPDFVYRPMAVAAPGWGGGGGAG